VTFINDSYPRATNADGNLQTEADWKVELTVVKKEHRLAPGLPFFPIQASVKTP